MSLINITPLISLIVVDVLGLNTLWNERTDRRCLHHLQSFNYNYSKTPVIYQMSNMIDKQDMDTIVKFDGKEMSRFSMNSSKILSCLFGGQYSKKTTMYFNDFNEKQKKILETVAKKLKQKLEKICNKKLHLGKSDFKAALLKYEGKGAHFTWHYDTEPYNCYRTLTLIKKKGEIPNFVYMDKYHKKQEINFDLNEGIFFKGTQTYHGVDIADDDNMERWMLGFQFYSGEYASLSRSFCSELRGKDVMLVVKTLIFKGVMTALIVYISGILLPKIEMFSSNYTSIASIIILSSFQAPALLPRNVGTGISSNIRSTLVMILYLVSITLNPYIALGYYAYVILTEMVLPRHIVAFNIENGGS